MPQIIYKEDSYRIIGTCMEVYNVLGSGFLESVYQEALALEFEDRGIPFVREKKLQVHYKQHVLQTKYRSDFIVFDKILVETKAIDALTNKDSSQLLNYLNATKFKLGILVNFGASSKLESKRIAL